MTESGVRWHLAVPPEASTEYAGTKLGDYYLSAEVKLHTQLTAGKRLHELYGLDLVGVSADPPAYLGVAALGAELVYPEDDAPMIKGHPIHDPAQIDDLSLPDRYCEHPAMAPHVAIWHKMQELVGEERKVGLGSGVEGPVTSAKLLRGQDFFSDLYLHPESAHKLLQIVTDSFIRFRREVAELQGAQMSGGTGICDDFAGLIGPNLYREFVLPYHRQIYEAFGPGSRGLHSELLRPAHLPFLDELGVTSFDPGQDQYLTLEDIIKGTNVPFTWNLFTIKDMKEGTPESVKRTYTQAVEGGAKSIMAELCRGTPRENIVAFIEIAREFE